MSKPDRGPNAGTAETERLRRRAGVERAMHADPNAFCRSRGRHEWMKVENGELACRDCGCKFEDGEHNGTCDDATGSS